MNNRDVNTKVLLLYLVLDSIALLPVSFWFVFGKYYYAPVLATWLRWRDTFELLGWVVHLSVIISIPLIVFFSSVDSSGLSGIRQSWKIRIFISLSSFLIGSMWLLSLVVVVLMMMFGEIAHA